MSIRAGPSGRPDPSRPRPHRRSSPLGEVSNMARRLNTILVDMGFLDEEAMWNVMEEAKRQGVESIGKVAIGMGLLTEEKYLKALGEHLGMKVVSLAEM